MGSDVSEVQDIPLHPSFIKSLNDDDWQRILWLFLTYSGKSPRFLPIMQVHFAMCTQLLELVDKISSILPDIEAARPRCTLGIQALCLLQSAIEKARTLVHNCCQSSKLYLALTGDTVVSRFERTRKLLQESLSQLQNMVPVLLGFEISEILDELQNAVFFADSHEEEAGKALLALLQKDQSMTDSDQNSEGEVLQFVALRLHLTSKKDLLIEIRSIRKLLDEVKDGNSKKRMTLKYLLHLLKKYDKQIIQGRKRKPSNQNDGYCLFVESNSKPVITHSTNLKNLPDLQCNDAQAIPAEEFKCPLSNALMYDPVVISTGQTFERIFIEKWFEQGQDTCPITKLRLTDMSVMPNTALRDLISKWTREHGIVVSDPAINISAVRSFENSISICSTASSMKDLHLQIDLSNLSLGSLDSSYNSDFSCSKAGREPSDVDSHVLQFYQSIHDIKRQLLSNIRALPWESQCGAVWDVNYYLVNYNPSCTFVSSHFVEPLVQFLEDALDRHDEEALKAGTLLFLTYLRASRETSNMSEDIYVLLGSLLRTEATSETLSIIEVLSARESAFPNLSQSGTLTTILNILDSHNTEFQEAAIRILYNLSLSIDISSCKIASDWIPKLVPLFKDTSVAGTCLRIIQNLCQFQEAKVSIAETDNCIASIVELLETDSCEVQEHAVGVLLSLCARNDYYCHLVLDEGVIPALVLLSINGNEKGKTSALELLRLLRDVVKCGEDEEECPISNSDACEIIPKKPEEKKSSRMPGSFGKKMKKLLRKN